MTCPSAVLAVTSGALGAMLLYVDAPQQQLRAAGRTSPRWRWWPGTICLLLSLLAMCRVLAPVEAVSAWLLLVTFVCSLAPFLGAWRAKARATR